MKINKLILMLTLSCACSRQIEHKLFNETSKSSTQGENLKFEVNEKKTKLEDSIVKVFCRLISNNDTINGYWWLKTDTLFLTKDSFNYPIAIYSLGINDSMVIRPRDFGFLLDAYEIKTLNLNITNDDTIIEVSHRLNPSIDTHVDIQINSQVDINDYDSIQHMKNVQYNSWIYWKISLRKGVIGFKKVRSKVDIGIFPYSSIPNEEW